MRRYIRLIHAAAYSRNKL